MSSVPYNSWRAEGQQTCLEHGIEMSGECKGDACYSFLHERLTQGVKSLVQHVGLRQCALAQMRCSNFYALSQCSSAQSEDQHAL